MPTSECYLQTPTTYQAGASLGSSWCLFRYLSSTRFLDAAALTKGEPAGAQDTVHIYSVCARASYVRSTSYLLVLRPLITVLIWSPPFSRPQSAGGSQISVPAFTLIPPRLSTLTWRGGACVQAPGQAETFVRVSTPHAVTATPRLVLFNACLHVEGILVLHTEASLDQQSLQHTGAGCLLSHQAVDDSARRVSLPLGHSGHQK